MKEIKNKEYLDIVNDILSNEEFIKMETFVHHKKNRLEHSIRVSYYSYIIAKFLRLDYHSVARGALLHDFFYGDTNSLCLKDRIKLLFKHPKEACSNSKNYFELNFLEEDIIMSHMFPVGVRMPKYLESWIVDIVDDFSSVYEKVNSEYRIFKERINN